MNDLQNNPKHLKQLKLDFCTDLHNVFSVFVDEVYSTLTKYTDSGIDHSDFVESISEDMQAIGDMSLKKLRSLKKIINELKE